MTDRFPSGIDHYDFGDELSRLERASRFHEWTKNLFDEGPHLVSCPELPWGDEVRHQSDRGLPPLHPRRDVDHRRRGPGDGGRDRLVDGRPPRGRRAGRVRHLRRFGVEHVRHPRGARTGGGRPSGGSVVYPANAHYSMPKLCRMFGLEPIVRAVARRARTSRSTPMPIDGRHPARHHRPHHHRGHLGLRHRRPHRGHRRDRPSSAACTSTSTAPSGATSSRSSSARATTPTIPRWDFRVPGVSTISADLHKNGMAPPPAGTLFFRDADLLEHAEGGLPAQRHDDAAPGAPGPSPAPGPWSSSSGEEGYQRCR